MTSPGSHNESSPQKAGFFATTHWSVVLAAGRERTDQGNEALERLCRCYWYPLYAYLRRRGSSTEDAQDMIQSFFVRIFERSLLEKASPDRGRFRSFLLTTLQNFLADEHDKRVALKRGGGEPLVWLDAMDAEARYKLEPVETMSPDKLFERRWATTVLNAAWERLRQEYAADGQAGLFDRLRAFDSAEKAAPAYSEVAVELGMPENTVKSLVHRLRRRYRSLLREQIAQTVASPLEIEEEIRYLLRVLEQA